MAEIKYLRDSRTGITHEFESITDATLTTPGRAADAKKVGDELANFNDIEIYADGTTLVINTNLTNANEVNY